MTPILSKSESKMERILIYYLISHKTVCKFCVHLSNIIWASLQWRHNERHGVSNHQHFECLLSRLFRGTSKKTSKLHVTGLCDANTPVTDGFPSQRASNAGMFSIDDVIMILISQVISCLFNNYFRLTKKYIKADYHCHYVRGIYQRPVGSLRKYYGDVIMGAIASQITSLTTVYSTVYSDADQRKHQRSASLAFVWGIHRNRWIPRTNGQ